MAVLRVRDNEGKYIRIPAIEGEKGKSAYQSAVDGGYKGTEEEFNSALADIGMSKRPTATIELSAADGFISNQVGFVSMSEGSFFIGDPYYEHDEYTLPVGTEIAKIEVRGQDDDPETGWVDLTEIYTRDDSYMQGFYSKVFMVGDIKIFGGAIYQYCGDSFIVSELNKGKNPVARITYYID